MTKQLVKLRQRKMQSGNISLYLDILYQGKRRWEYLKLYLADNPQSAEVRKKNKETLRFAQAIQAQRIVEIQNKEYGFKGEVDNTSFLAYFNDVVSTKKGGTQKVWQSVYVTLQAFCNESTRIKDVDEAFLEKYKNHLDRHKKKNGTLLAANTKWNYYSKVTAVLNLLVKDGTLNTSPANNVQNLKKEDVERIYLTTDELKKLIATPVRHTKFRNAFIFSCLTGLRWSDIETLKWGMVQHDNEGNCRLHFKQEKTEGQEYLDINNQAASIMGDRGKSTEHVFRDIRYNAYISKMLTNWATKAGIERKLTFHSARHSFAIMMIDLNVDLYVVSKLMGHKDVKTTQIYAKVRDKKKKEAVSKIPDFSINS
jgi:integrase